MELRTGLNPYGLTYHLGLQGRGTPRANPDGRGLEGFITLAQELGSRTLELWGGWLAPMSDAELANLRSRLVALDMTPVVSSGLQHADIESCLRAASALGSKYVRFALTPILCGDRAAAGPRWAELRASVRDKLGPYAVRPAAAGLTHLL